MLKLTIDTDTLSLGDVEELETLKKVGDITRWLVAHAGVTAEQVKAVPVKELKGVMQQVNAAIGESIGLPKANAASS